MAVSATVLTFFWRRVTMPKAYLEKVVPGRLATSAGLF
jgi:hypothetical protein